MNNSNLSKTVLSLITLGLLTVSPESISGPVSLPPVPLGNTSFEDGIVGPGFLYEQVIDYYNSDHTRDHNGDKLPGHQRQRTTAVITHFAWISDHRLLNARYGAEILLPITHINLNISDGPSGTRTRPGDLIISPLILQWDPVNVFGRPFWQRFDFLMTLPTGDYSAHNKINTGSHLWQFTPYYAFTWLATDNLEVSGRIHYSTFSKNDDVTYAHSIQPGSVLHSNWAVSYEVTSGLRLGVAGYYLKQLEDDEINGHKLHDSKEQVIGYGPGAMYKNGNNIFYVNAYWESGAENRGQGNRIELRYLHPF